MYSYRHGPGGTEYDCTRRHRQCDNHADVYADERGADRHFFHFGRYLCVDGAQQLYFYHAKPHGEHGRHLYTYGYQSCQWMYQLGYGQCLFHYDSAGWGDCHGFRCADLYDYECDVDGRFHYFGSDFCLDGTE
jgi:hypothetical protein